MPKKYLPAAHSAMLRLGSAQVITNDLFLAAFLRSTGCTLERIERNQRRRVSFVFAGEQSRRMREEYRTGPVRVDMRTFRDNLNALRDQLKVVAGRPPEERSAAHDEHAARSTRLRCCANG
jgi:hypothetical protein